MNVSKESMQKSVINNYFHDRLVCPLFSQLIVLSVKWQKVEMEVSLFPREYISTVCVIWLTGQNPTISVCLTEKKKIYLLKKLLQLVTHKWNNFVQLKNTID